MITSSDAFAYDHSVHEDSVQAWRRARLSRLTAPDGWLSLLARTPLAEGDNIVGAAGNCDVTLPENRANERVGVFRRADKSVTFTPADGTMISLRNNNGIEQLMPGVTIPVRTDRDGTPDILLLADGALTMEITDRRSGMFVRVRDSESPTRLQFAGIDHYPVLPKWRVVASLQRHVPEKTIDLGYEANTSEHYTSPGIAVFEIDGVQHRLEVVFDSNRSRLYIVFWDQTARDTTYGAGRFLYAPLPEADRVLLDFNLAFSPPCAFTPFAACPLAPPQNRLACRVEAGEKRPR